MEIDLELYRVFYVVAKHKNVTKASKSLHISQPAVSKHIKHLEDLLEVQLFIRTPKGLSLTTEGLSIYNKVKQAMFLLEDINQDLDDFKYLRRGSISIGISTTLTKLFLMEFLSEFHKKYPNIMIDIHTDDSTTLKELLKEGKIDILFSKITNKDFLNFFVQKLGTLHYIFTCNRDYYEELHGHVEMSDLQNYPLVLQSNKSNARRTFDEFCKKNEITTESIMDIDSSNLLISFIKFGFGIGFITKEYAEKDLKRKELFELSCNIRLPEQDFGYLLLEKNSHNLVVKELLGLIQNRL